MLRPSSERSLRMFAEGLVLHSALLVLQNARRARRDRQLKEQSTLTVLRPYVMHQI
jgi:hypothetical protein